MLRPKSGSRRLVKRATKQVPSSGTMINVAHVITGLGPGGAENMLLKLLAHADRQRFAPRVYALTDSNGRIREQIEALGVPVATLGMERRTPNPVAIGRLARLLRNDRTDLVQTWMYHADLVGSVAARLGGPSIPVVWNLRQSNLDPAVNRKRTLALIRLNAKLSSWLPNAIVCGSSEARRVHAAVGYCDSKLHVIPNGFDVAAFRPDPDARASMRAMLDIPDSALVIGMVARFDPTKDHGTFLDAAARLRTRWPDVRFVLCGNRTSRDNAQLVDWVDAAGLGAVCTLLGERNDIPRVVATFDLATLSSVGEGFPNVIGEAMACGVPCVSTNVGDAAELIGDTGMLVPPRDPAALAQAWHTLLATGQRNLVALGTRARERVTERFSISVIARAYEMLYESIARVATREM